MKCPECDGVGRIHYGEEWCSACNGTGEIVTNDEWRKTCSAEEFAEWLALSGYGSCVHFDCETCEFYDKKLDDCIDGWDISHEKKRWVEWLKQPHTIKEIHE